MVEKDVIEYEIEISTRSSDEIKRLISEINEADKKATNLKSRKLQFESQGAPIQTPSEEQKFGIFAGEMEDFAFPDQSRDKTSKQAIHRPSSFKELERRVEEQESKQNGILQTVQSSGLLAILSGNGDSLINKFLHKIGPIAGPVFIAIGIIDFWLDYMFKPGGPFDRRYKRNLLTEIAKSTDRQLKGLLRQGYAEVRITSIPNLRGGKGLVNTNFNYISKAQIQNQDIELLGKGMI